MRAHAKYLSYVVRHKWFVFLAGLKTGAPLWRLIIHDWSKFTPAEWGPYVRNFYGAPRAEWIERRRLDHLRPHEGVLSHEAQWRAESEWPAEDASRASAFDRAWLHHQHANPHHWQHWMLREDSGALKLLPMPEHFYREMVADWMGAGRAITGKWEAAAWYVKNRDVIQLDQLTRIRVEGLLARHAGLTCVWGCNGASPTYCNEVLNGCEAHMSSFGPRNDASRAEPALAVDPSWSTPNNAGAK
jgi:hypothetical protein